MKPFTPRPIAGIQIAFPVLINQNTGIELDIIFLLSSQRCSIRIMYQSHKFIRPRRRIADCNTNFRQHIETVIKVIPSIQPLCHIGSPHAVPSLLVSGILVFPVNHPFITPFLQIFRIRRIAHVIIHTISVPIKPVVAPKQIDSAVKNMRFPIRYIFPRW